MKMSRAAYDFLTPREKAAILNLYRHGFSTTHISHVSQRSVSTVWRIIDNAKKLVGIGRRDNRTLPRQLRDHLARAAKFSVRMRSWRAALFTTGWLNDVEEILLGPKQTRQVEGEEEEEPP